MRLINYISIIKAFALCLCVIFPICAVGLPNMISYLLLSARSSTLIVSGYDGCCIARPGLGYVATVALLLYVSLLKLDMEKTWLYLISGVM